MTINQILLELLRSAVLDKEPNLPKDIVVNWNELMDVSSRHGVLAWVWDGICKLPIDQQPPRQQRINWALSAQEIWDRYHKQKAVLSEMVDVCNKNDMRLLLLKGIGLSELYPKPESRPSGDIDIYLFKDYDKGNDIFCHKDSKFCNKHTEFDYLGVHIENHQTPLDVDTKQRRLVEAYVENELSLSTVTTQGYYVMQPMTNLVYLVMHTIRHCEPNTYIHLKNIVDIGLFIIKNSKDIDACNCYSIFKRLNLATQFELLVVMVECVLGVSLIGYQYGLVSLKQKKFIKKSMVISLMENPVPNGFPFIMGSPQKWIQYFTLVCMYRKFSDKEVHYYTKIFRHLGVVLFNQF